MAKDFFTEEEILFVLKRREAGKEFDKIAIELNNKFNKSRTENSVYAAYRRYKDYCSTTDGSVKLLKEKFQTQKRAAITLKENRHILEHISQKESIMDSINDAVKKINKQKTTKVKPAKKTTKKNMTLELLVSDVHFGKRTDSVDSVAIRNRVRKMAQVTLD
jgi:hypothetical protein